MVVTGDSFLQGMEALICQLDLISWELFAWQALRSEICGDIAKAHPALGLFSLAAFPCGHQHWQGQCEPYQESQQSSGDESEDQGGPDGVSSNLLIREKAQAEVSQLMLPGLSSSQGFVFYDCRTSRNESY